jgi:tryptophan-rich sensory protein
MSTGADSPATPTDFRPARLLALAGWIALCLAAGGIGAVVSGPDEWYRALNKPTWNPPAWVFGPVWTTLYVMMGVAAWLVWLRRARPGAPLALVLFAIQLALNAAWSWIFFGGHQIGAAFAELLLLWAALVATLLAFRRVRPAAAWWLVPYWAWTSFAAVLNGTLWWLNQ